MVDSARLKELLSHRSAKITDESNLNDSKKSILGARKMPHKWSREEKENFSKTLDKHGKKWEILANAVSTKTISQIKKYYSDNFSRQKSNHHSSRDSKTKKSGLIVALDLSHKVGSH